MIVGCNFRSHCYVELGFAKLLLEYANLQQYGGGAHDLILGVVVESLRFLPCVLHLLPYNKRKEKFSVVNHCC